MEVYIFLFSILGFSIYYDYRYQRIPNALSLGGFVVGIALAAADASHGITLTNAVLGGLLGLILFMPFHVAGKMGAGDVKMLAMSGTFLGPFGVLYASVFTLIAGAVLAIIWIVSRLVKESITTRVANALSIDTGEACPSGAGVATVAESKSLKRSPVLMNSKFPYAASIAIGTLAAASI